VLAGLAAAGLDLSQADLIVGTSAGSVAGAQLAGGEPLAKLYARQLEIPAVERVAHIGPRVKLGFGKAMLLSRGDIASFGRHLGEASIKAAAAGRLPTLESRYAAIRSRLPGAGATEAQWPDRDLLICVVNAHTGQFRALGRADGVPLLDAVAASCAVPTVYPPVPIGTEVYIDGGVRSSANVDVAAGCTAVVVLAPIATDVGPLVAPAKQADARTAPRWQRSVPTSLTLPRARERPGLATPRAPRSSTPCAPSG
jgi:NTE family protein